MKQQVKRLTLTGNWQEFSFPYKARRFFVKNFTGNDIYVSFENNTPENESFKISSGIAEELAISYIDIRNEKAQEAFVVDKIYVKGTGEVEVQEVDFDV